MKLVKLLIPTLVAGAILAGCQKTNTVTSNRKPPMVNAGADQTITLPVDSVLVTGSVKDSGSKVVAYLWSEVSGPNVPVIADEGSISTKIHGLTAGTYIFQLMATDTFGLTGVDTMQIVVNPPTTITLVADSAHALSNEFLGGAGYDWGGPTIELGAEEWTIGGTPVAVRSALRFDMSSLPNLPIKSAKITLYSDPTPHTANLVNPNFGTSNAFYIQRIATSWTASNSWSTMPVVDTTNEVLIPQTNASSLDLVGVDVTALVNKMISAGNYGFMIRLQTEVTYNSRIFCSNTYSDATKHPALVISY